MTRPVTFDIPPLNTPIMFLAGESGCIPHWYAGFAWQSSEPNQPLKFYVYPWFLGYPPEYPPFNAAPYRGKWYEIKDPAMLVIINGKREQPTLFDMVSEWYVEE